MSNDNTLSLYDSMIFVQYAVRKLPGIWNSKSSNNSGLRAIFRRWHPDSTVSMEMRQYVWDTLFRSMYDNDATTSDSKSDTGRKMKSLLARHADTEGNISDDLVTLVDRIAVILALRAVAGEQEYSTETDDIPTSAEEPTENLSTEEQHQTQLPHKRKRSLGNALQKTGMTDLRLMRLMTTPREGRLEALHRALRLLAAKSVYFDWNWSETYRIFLFLFGSEEQAQKSINNWTANFLANRSYIEASEENEPSIVE